MLLITLDDDVIIMSCSRCHGNGVGHPQSRSAGVDDPRTDAGVAVGEGAGREEPTNHRRGTRRPLPTRGVQGEEMMSSPQQGAAVDVLFADPETPVWVPTHQDSGSQTDCHAYPNGHEWIPVPNGRQSGAPFHSTA